MDWNIFFSTVSQTCGAVVGIFSAFLITKIIADQSEFSKLKDKVSEMVSKSEYLQAHFARANFDSLNKSELEDLSSNLYEALKESDIDKEPSFYYNFVEQPLYASKDDALEYIKYAMEKAEGYQLEQKRKREDETHRKANERILKKIMGEQGLKHMQLMESITKSQTSIQVESPLDRIQASLADNSIRNREEASVREQLIIDASHQISLNKKLLEDMEGSNTAHQLISRSLIIVLLLFYIGVIYPLSFLPLNPGAEIALSFMAFFDILFSLKGILLGLLTISFSFLITSFWSVNNRLKLSTRQTNELKCFSRPEGFGKYLKNYFDNK